MLYLLEMGPVEQGIIKQSIRAGEPLPDRIANAPQLIYGLNLYIQAFFELDSTRINSFSVGRIAWTAIKDYAIAFEFDEAQIENLFYFIREMDSVYMTWNREKAESK